MYRAYVNDLLIHDQASPNKDIHLVDPKLELVDNAAGSFEFTIPMGHSGYDDIETIISTIIVQREGHVIWTGRATKETEDFWGRRKFSCEGALAYLNDTLQPRVTYNNATNDSFFVELIKAHNAKVRADRRFSIGKIEISDVGDVYEYETDYQGTLSIIQEVFLDRLGGHIYLTYNDNDFDISHSEIPTPIINYVSGYNVNDDQYINFGSNLLDYTSDWDLSDLVTVIYPRGKQLDNKQTEVTSSDSNYNVNYTENKESSDSGDDIVIYAVEE